MNDDLSAGQKLNIYLSASDYTMLDGSEKCQIGVQVDKKHASQCNVNIFARHQANAVTC